MANIPNPDKIGLTDQEKRKVDARKWQNENRDEYRAYQREYQRKYIKDPRKVKTRLERRIAEINLITNRIQLKYDSMLAPYLNELDQLVLQLNQQNALIESGELNYTARNGVKHGN